MPDLTDDQHLILAYLADATGPEFVSLRGMLGDRADVPREDFDRRDWETWTGLYFAVHPLLDLGLVASAAADGSEHLNRFQITDAGREALAGHDTNNPNRSRT